MQSPGFLPLSKALEPLLEDRSGSKIFQLEKNLAVATNWAAWTTETGEGWCRGERQTEGEEKDAKLEELLHG